MGATGPLGGGGGDTSPRSPIWRGRGSRDAYGWTGGSVLDPEVLRHVGWPKPPALIPVPPYGLGAMSKMILSGRAGSPETPPTPDKWSSPRLLRDTPRDVVVGTGSVTADAYSANQYLTCGIKPETSPENVYAADLVANHGVLSCADLLGRAAIRLLGLNWVAVLQTKKTASRLHGGVQVGRRQGKAVRLS